MIAPTEGSHEIPSVAALWPADGGTGSAYGPAATIMRLIGTSKRVLDLHNMLGELARPLTDRGCHIVAVAPDNYTAARTAALRERVIVGDPRKLDLNQELVDELFDVVLVCGPVAQLTGPSGLLLRLRKLLLPEGYIVALLPPPAYGGDYAGPMITWLPQSGLQVPEPTLSDGARSPMAEQLFADAGYLMAYSSQHGATLAAPAHALGKDEGTVQPAHLPSVVVAYPISVAALALLRAQSQQLNEQRVAAQREASELRQTVAQQTKYLDSLELVAEWVQRQANRDNDIHAVLQTLHSQFHQVRDERTLQYQLADLQRRVEQLIEERSAAQREAADLRQIVEHQAKYLDSLEVMAEWVQRLAHQNDELHTALVHAREQLLQKDDVLHGLIDDARERLLQKDDVLHGLIDDARERLLQKGDVLHGLIDDARERLLQKGDDARERLLQKSDDLRERMLQRSDDLREQVMSVRDHLLLRLESLEATVTAQQQAAAYEQLLQHIREVVRANLPTEATVAVVSKGDDNLLLFDGRQGWHFPQNEDGSYSGYNPTDSAAAIAELELLRHKGATFLILPNSAFWWLDYYSELYQHLESQYQRVWADEQCIIYRI